MSFQPFAVQCLTCGSRLRVTDPAVVGTIAACPKCNSMVQIEPPADPSAANQVAVGSPGVDSQAITQEAISREQELDADSAAAAPGDSPSGVHGFSGDAAGGIGDSLPPDWQSARTRRTRQIALVTLVSVTGLLTAIVVFSWFVHSYRQRSATAQSDPAAAAEQESSSGEAETLNADDDPQTSTDSDGNVEIEDPSSDAETSSNIDAAVKSESSSDAAPSTSSADSVSPPSDLIPSSPLDDLIPTSPLDDPGNAENGSTDPEIDPPIALVPEDPLAAPDPSEDEVSGMQQLPPELEKYTKFLFDEGVVEETNLPAPPTMEQIEIEAAAEQDFNPLGIAPPRELNLKADLAMRMALSSDGYPLSDLVSLISQTTGVPIQIDWVSFDLAGISVDRRIPTVQGWHTARQVLDKTAESFGAELREEKTLVILTLSDETFQQTMDSLSDLKDFDDGGKSAVQVLNKFLGANPEMATLALGETREQRQLAGLAIEAMRRMRGVDPKVPNEVLNHWAAGTEQPIRWPKITGGQTGPQADSPMTLAAFLRHTSRRNQATCVVNWYDALLRGATPETLLIPHAKEDAAAMLEHALQPFELQVRQVDAKHWWVGTEPTYDRLTAVMWTPPLGESRQDFLQRIDAIMAGASAETFRVAYDETSDRALLLLPRYIVRQLPKIAPSIAVR